MCLLAQIREELEHLLETDGHMAEMYLTRKAAGGQEGHENPCAFDDDDDDEDEDDVEINDEDK